MSHPALPTGDHYAPTEYASLIHSILAETLPARSETLPLGQVAGRVLAEDLTAPYPAPSFTNSQMDGYALTATGATAPRRIFQVGPDIPAGSATRGHAVADHLAYPIMTGAPLPAGYRAVVPVELTRVIGAKADQAGFAPAGGQVEIPVAEPGQFVRNIGEDILAGELLAPAGTPLTPALLGALAAQGIGQVPVREKLRLLVVTGGDELAPHPSPGEGDTAQVPPAAGTIFDANGPMLRALAEHDGCITERLATSDSTEDFCTGLTEAVERFHPDLVVTSGGISAGKYEVVRKGLTRLAPQTWFGHVTQQPGGPQGIALLPGSGSSPLPVLCLPGNPVSTLISYHLLLRPTLAALAGRPVSRREAILVTDQALQAPAGKTQYRRASLKAEVQKGGAVLTLATPDPATGSHLLHRAAQAQALIELEPDVVYTAGKTVTVIPL